MTEADRSPSVPTRLPESYGAQEPEGRGAHRSPLSGAVPRSGTNAGPGATPKPWTIPRRGLAVFHGPGETPRLSHYFLPRLLLQGKRVLFLDGANSADPRLLARLARERGVPFERFSQQVQFARAFTCFQLTELIARVPRFLKDFPAEVLVVTALPELYYDQDVRDWDARVAFEQALGDLRHWAGGPRAEGRDFSPADGAPHPAYAGHPLPLLGDRGEGNIPPTAGLKLRPSDFTVAVFSAALDFTPSPARRHFFPQTCAAATEVWQFSLGEGDRLRLVSTRAPARLGAGALRSG